MTIASATWPSSEEVFKMGYTALEAASWANLNEEAYLMANPDVKEAGMSARDHFRQSGEAEGRMQFSSEYMRTLLAPREPKLVTPKEPAVPRSLESSRRLLVCSDRKLDILEGTSKNCDLRKFLRI
jgi:hypothetical protein